MTKQKKITIINLIILIYKNLKKLFVRESDEKQDNESKYSTFMNTEKTEKNTGTWSFLITTSKIKNTFSLKTETRSIPQKNYQNFGPTDITQSEQSQKPQPCIKHNIRKKT